MTLENICKKYSNKEYNQENYEIGGGLSDFKFASKRHEDAKNDSGKLTLGQAVQLFKNSTGKTIEQIKKIINDNFQLEWHHAGKLPKQYGGKMKKTYFLNSHQICELAKNFDIYYKEIQISELKESERIENEKIREKNEKQFFQQNCIYRYRILKMPEIFILKKREMNGKFGWFDSEYKNYNLTEYFTGWEFPSKEKFNEYLAIFK